MEIEIFDQYYGIAENGATEALGTFSEKEFFTVGEADTIIDGIQKEKRVVKKAKRFGRVSPSAKEAIVVNGVHNVAFNGSSKATLQALLKNSRKPRNGHGRGEPKKGGAGGKGVWGRPGVEADMVETGCRDVLDPNYDSGSEEDCTLSQVTPELTEEDFQVTVTPILAEYLEHGDTGEVVTLLRNVNLGKLRHRVVFLAVAQALEKHNPHRELTSRLLADLNGQVVSEKEMVNAFNDLLSNLSELSLDTPEAPALVGQFMARAVADDCLSTDYVNSYLGKHLTSSHIRVALDKADVLLSLGHGMAKLDNVWGVGGGNRPVRYLVNQMVLLLKEFLSSGDLSEATRCLKELDVPHFHHELVYQAVIIVLESGLERTLDAIVKLLKDVTGSAVISQDQFDKGVHRVFDEIADICLDVPAAYSLLERFGDKLHNEHVMSNALYKDMPSRGRKRLVSDGDGGLIKGQQL